MINMTSIPATTPNIAHMYGGKEDQNEAVTVNDLVFGPTSTT
jgi:hypothetical protein